MVMMFESSSSQEAPGLAHASSSEMAAILFIDEVASVLRVSRSTIERRRRDGTFPIPELPKLRQPPTLEPAGCRDVSRVFHRWSTASSRLQVSQVVRAMSSKIQQTVAAGIYRLGSGAFRVKVAVGDRKRGGHQRETTFPRTPGCAK